MSELNDFETTMVNILESGGEPRVSDFGSLEKLLTAAETIGRTPLLPEFVRATLHHSHHQNVDSTKCWKFVEESLPTCSNGGAITEIIDLIDQAPRRCATNLFRILLQIYSDSEISSHARASALDGAVRFVIRDPQLRFELISNLLKITERDDFNLIRSTAKIIGVVNAHWPEKELFDKLVELAINHDALDQVAFEIGSCKIQCAMNALDAETVEKEFHDSKFWFEQSLIADSDRHDSAIYLECVKCLLDFYNGKAIDTKNILANLKKHVTFLKAWNRTEAGPPWLLDDMVKLFYWELLAGKIGRLSEELLQPAWYEIAVVVENYLVAVWTASQAILMKNSESGIESIVRPRIEGTVAATNGQLFAIKEWLRRNREHEKLDTVRELAERVDEIAEANADTQLDEGTDHGQIVLETIKGSSLFQKEAALQTIIDAHLVSIENLTQQQFVIIEECIGFVGRHPDYKNDVYRRLFNSILLWTVRFLHSRLEMTKKDEPAISYLFKQDGGKKPTEDKLQADYKNVMVSTTGGTEIEVMNVAGGRADVLFCLSTERIVTEVKREGRDSSFENLIAEYSSQAADYQNVSGRLGFVLVLDQTTPDTGTPHISALVKPIQVTRNGESTPRMLVFVKVPGERLRPSDLTKVAKKKGARDRQNDRKNNK